MTTKNTIQKRKVKAKETKAEARTKIINSDVYCVKCETFLGMTCDPFRASCCKRCFPKT